LDSDGCFRGRRAAATFLIAFDTSASGMEPGRFGIFSADKRWVLRLEFKRFGNALVHLPCQIIRTSGKLVYRLLAWNPYQPIFFRLLDVLRC
jgi:hypothetical protein